LLKIAEKKIAEKYSTNTLSVVKLLAFFDPQHCLALKKNNLIDKQNVRGRGKLTAIYARE